MISLKKSPFIFLLVLLSQAINASEGAVQEVNKDFTNVKIEELTAPPSAGRFEAKCRIDISNDTLLLMAGNKAGRDLNVSMGSNQKASTAYKVVVNVPRKVALFLNSESPAVWDISWTAGSEIVAVYVLGPSTQVLNGLPSNVKFVRDEYQYTHNGKVTPCGAGHTSLDLKLPEASKIAYQVFGKSPDMAFLTANGYAVLGRALEPGQKTHGVSYEELKEIAKNNKSQELGGLDQLARAGKITKISIKHPKVIEFTKAKFNRELRTGDRRNNLREPGSSYKDYLPKFHDYRMYIINEKIKIPEGLAGANSVRFILPQGVAPPVGDFGHSVIYVVETGECVDSSAGSICKMVSLQ